MDRDALYETDVPKPWNGPIRTVRAVEHHFREGRALPRARGPARGATDR
ncbi:hypothetical protein ACFVXC_36715 [Streptomyces sp. NPDC058257]